MPDSIREQIVQAFVALMSTITVANGYQVPIGENVLRGTTFPIEKDELPGIIVNEGKETSDSTVNAGFDHHYLPLDIVARSSHEDGESFYIVSNKMLADIVKAMGTDSNLGGLAFDLQLGNNQTGVDDGDKLIAGTDLNITVHYRTRHLDPFN